MFLVVPIVLTSPTRGDLNSVSYLNIAIDIVSWRITRLLKCGWDREWQESSICWSDWTAMRRPHTSQYITPSAYHIKDRQSEIGNSATQMSPMICIHFMFLLISLVHFTVNCRTFKELDWHLVDVSGSCTSPQKWRFVVVVISWDSHCVLRDAVVHEHTKWWETCWIWGSPWQSAI